MKRLNKFLTICLCTFFALALVGYNLAGDINELWEKAKGGPADGGGPVFMPVFMEMVNIKAGTLTWTYGGSTIISLSAFKMGKYEVTQEQYQEVTHGSSCCHGTPICDRLKYLKMY